jgi:hypothetical protein
MITHDQAWSLPRGNTQVPSRWQATKGLPAVHRSLAGRDGYIAWPGQRQTVALWRSRHAGFWSVIALEVAFMIADPVRYMSVHSWKQPDPHGRRGTLPTGKATAREPRKSQVTGRFRRWWQVLCPASGH